MLRPIALRACVFPKPERVRTDERPDFNDRSLPQHVELVEFVPDISSPKNPDEDYAAIVQSTDVLHRVFRDDWTRGLTYERNLAGHATALQSMCLGPAGSLQSKRRSYSASGRLSSLVAPSVSLIRRKPLRS